MKGIGIGMEDHGMGPRGQGMTGKGGLSGVQGSQIQAMSQSVMRKKVGGDDVRVEC